VEQSGAACEAYTRCGSRTSSTAGDGQQRSLT
jgi:hypothetical protein